MKKTNQRLRIFLIDSSSRLNLKAGHKKFSKLKHIEEKAVQN